MLGPTARCSTTLSHVLPSQFILDKVKQNQAFKSVVETLGKEQTH